METQESGKNTVDVTTSTTETVDATAPVTTDDGLAKQAFDWSLVDPSLRDHLSVRRYNGDKLADKELFFGSLYHCSVAATSFMVYMKAKAAQGDIYSTEFVRRFENLSTVDKGNTYNLYTVFNKFFEKLESYYEYQFSFLFRNQFQYNFIRTHDRDKNPRKNLDGTLVTYDPNYDIPMSQLRDRREKDKKHVPVNTFNNANIYMLVKLMRFMTKETLKQIFKRREQETYTNSEGKLESTWNPDKASFGKSGTTSFEFTDFVSELLELHTVLSSFSPNLEEFRLALRGCTDFLREEKHKLQPTVEPTQRGTVKVVIRSNKTLSKGTTTNPWNKNKQQKSSSTDSKKSTDNTKTVTAKQLTPRRVKVETSTSDDTEWQDVKRKKPVLETRQKRDIVVTGNDGEKYLVHFNPETKLHDLLPLPEDYEEHVSQTPLPPRAPKKLAASS